MGSYLSGIAPAQILSAENYFIELPEFHFESSLGSTRFLKVARAKNKEGHVVIKVFVIHDPSLPLSSYQEELTRITKAVSGCPNVLPFQKTLLTDRAGLLIRQYVHDNLYDRISTRPFLNIVEKKWIVFQLLCSLEQLHGAKVCHGDIKTENVLVTSWSWVLITDIASFKPVLVPAEDPADFNFFFDTSRRRTCYLAPERFVDTNGVSIDPGSSSFSGDENNKQDTGSLPLIGFHDANQTGLKETMDIFSAGCVVAELFCEGTGLFDLSQLLAYRKKEYNPEPKLSKLDDHINDMIRHMIQLDPSKRLSAKEYMSKYRGRVFPEEFYSFLKNYICEFAGVPVMTSDEKIAKIANDINKIKNSLYNESHLEDSMIESVEDDTTRQIPVADNCFVLIVSLVTSCVRSLKFCISKLTALDLMLDLSQYVPDDIRLELLLPYMFYFVNDPIPRVRAKSITTITKCVQRVEVIPKNEANIFPEYILQNLSQLANDPEVVVQCAFAENISTLAETALRFLELAQLESFSSDQDDQSQYQVSYDVELHALHELIQNKVVALLTNSDNIVKRTLMENGLTPLCVFFGRQKAKDVLLLHIITFLNDKQDWQLRATFFDCIVGVAVYIGWQCLPILKPLMQQGLKDSEEYVVVRTLYALKSLVELSLLQKPMIFKFIADVVCFLAHPSLWIRYGAVGFVVICAKTLSQADTHCGLMPFLQPYLKDPIIQVDNQTILLSDLQEPVPRAIYDYIIRSPHASAFLARLEAHHQENTLAPFTPSSTDILSQVARKLKSQGMTVPIEKKIVQLKEIILRLNSQRIKSGDFEDSIYHIYNRGYLDIASDTSIDESVNLDSNSSFAISKPLVTSRRRKLSFNSPFKSSPSQHTSMSKSVGESSIKVNINMICPDNQQPREIILAGVLDLSSLISSPTKREIDLTRVVDTTDDRDVMTHKRPNSQLKVPIITQNAQDGSPTDSGSAQSSPVDDAKTALIKTKLDLDPGPPIIPIDLTETTRYPQCKQDIVRLSAFKRNQFNSDMRQKSLLKNVFDAKGKKAGWKPEGQLVAHLHEHKEGINRIVVSEDNQFFATASDDSSVKIWETQRLEGKSLTTRSKYTYTKQVGKINCLTFCQNSTTIACSSSEDASIHVFRIDPTGSGNKLPLLIEKKLNAKEEGCAVDMHRYNTGNQSIVTYATVHGYLCGWDLRQPKERYAWKLKNDIRLGLITSFAVDGMQCWLTCGTSDGALVCWDMRFQLPITQIIHPRKARVRRVSCHPVESSWVVASYQGNNEVSMWDLETSAKRQTLWASQYPPLSQSQVSPESVFALHSSLEDSKPYFITAGSDKRIRYWNLAEPESSSIVTGSAMDNLDQMSSKYSNRMIDGTDVLFETYEKRRSNMTYDERPRRGPDEPPTGHHDCITDIAVTKLPQNFLISCSNDGVVKVWK